MEKNLKSLLLASASVLLLSTHTQGAVLGWNFGTSTGSRSLSSGTPQDFSVDDFSTGNAKNVATSNAVPSDYAGASGAFNYALAPSNASPTFDATNSAYYQLTLTPGAGLTIQLADFDFGMRTLNNAASPNAYSLRWSVDNYASQIAGGTLSINSAWDYKNNTFTSLTSTNPGEAVQLRLYLYGNPSAGSGTTVYNRLDDVSVTASAVPEPAPEVLLGISLAALLIFRRRNHVLSLEVKPESPEFAGR